MTAVEYLFKNYLDNPLSNQDVIYNINVFERAKEMEKQQIIDAMDVTQRTDFYVKYEGSEHYYNETFKTK
jgi:hypothetical protein